MQHNRDAEPGIRIVESRFGARAPCVGEAIRATAAIAPERMAGLESTDYHNFVFRP